MENDPHEDLRKALKKLSSEMLKIKSRRQDRERRSKIRRASGIGHFVSSYNWIEDLKYIGWRMVDDVSELNAYNSEFRDVTLNLHKCIEYYFGSPIKVPLMCRINREHYFGEIYDMILDVWLDMCFIPAGRFTMGSPLSEDGRGDDECQVMVEITRPFWLSKYPVTRMQWMALMDDDFFGFFDSTMPVVNIRWSEAEKYIERLNYNLSMYSNWKFSLPTEAQWEYACRSGDGASFPGGVLSEVGWYEGNSGNNCHGVGLKSPNQFGLYDMNGNVWEWCSDWYNASLVGGMNPSGPKTGEHRVARGGSWNHHQSACRSANRYKRHPEQGTDMGFRVALVACS